MDVDGDAADVDGDAVDDAADDAVDVDEGASDGSSPPEQPVSSAAPARLAAAERTRDLLRTDKGTPRLPRLAARTGTSQVTGAHRRSSTTAREAE
ncbi:hypothetical protein [Nocardioides yefusunii]|uniref:Uncharacterized protein n=1 Tax=Nocardioides yefusunii TaxID=2500546 RepID=A0ABW1QWF9_9ACTN|nr:hypothetical protein [Nocardioides yefusunii]